MGGELLTLIAITFGEPLATVLFLHITGANAYREMERRQARFREAYGDVPRILNEQPSRGE